MAAWSNKDTAMWSAAVDRRKFFENYAQLNKFDPLVPDNWYLQPKERILAHSVCFETFTTKIMKFKWKVSKYNFLIFLLFY